MGKLGDSYVASLGQQSHKFKIDRSLQKLMVVRSHPSYAMFGQILSALPEIITLENTNSNNQRISNADRVRLGYLACFAQFGEGVIPERITAGASRVFIPVVLGRDGQAVTGNDNYTLLIENMVPGATYEVFALETPTTGNRYWDYVQGSVLAGDHQKALDLDGTTAILLPASAGITRATVTFSTDAGDRICDYTLEELRFISAETNDIESIAHIEAQSGLVAEGTNVFGSMTSELVVIMLGPVKHIVFHTDGVLIDYVTVTERSRLVM